MIAADDLDALCAVAVKYKARGLNVTADGFEVVFAPPESAGKEKPPEAPPDEGAMPTRADIEADMERIRKGGVR